VWPVYGASEARSSCAEDEGGRRFVKEIASADKRVEIRNMERKAEETGNSMQRTGLSVLYPVRHLMVALFIHWVAEQMSVSVLVNITMEALCPRSNSCSEVIYLTVAQETVCLNYAQIYVYELLFT